MAFQSCDHRWVAEELVSLVLADAPLGYRRASDLAGPERTTFVEVVELARQAAGKGRLGWSHCRLVGGTLQVVRGRVEPARAGRQDRRSRLPRLVARAGRMTLTVATRWYSPVSGHHLRRSQTRSAFTSASSLPMVSLASPNSSVVVGSYSSSFSIPANPGRIDRFMKTTCRAWLACRIGIP